MKKIILFILSFILIFIAGFSQHVKDMNGSYNITNGLRVGDTISLSIGEYIREFSSDTLLADSSLHSLVTESAIKNYVDNITSSLSSYWIKTNNFLYPNTITDSIGIGLNNPINKFQVKDLFKDDATNRNLFIGDSAGYSMVSTDNVFLGYNAGKSITTKQGVVIGSYAGDSATSSNKCVIIGEEAGYYNQGTANNFIGRQAGQNNTSGTQNQFIGKEAGRYNISGSYNLAVGTQSLRDDTSGDYNVALGNNALQSTLNSQRNIGIGFASLNSSGLTFEDNFAAGYESGKWNGNSANSNIFIGYHSGFNNLGSNNIFQGYESGYSNLAGNDNIFLGYQSGYNNTIGNYNTSIGYHSGQLISTGSDNTTLGHNAGKNIYDGGNNVFIGNSTKSSGTAVSYNVGIGMNSLYQSTGIGNTAVGSSAGYGITTGAYNVLIGWNAGKGALSNYNTMIGSNAGQLSIGCTENTFLGHNAGLRSNGNYNVYLGSGAASGSASSSTGEKNLFMGYQSGYDITSASNSIMIGYQSGYKITTGSNNTFIGYQAGHENLTGLGNVYIGYQAGYNALDSNKLYIDNSSTATPLIYGDFANDYLKFNADSVRVTGNVYADTVHSHAFVGMSDFVIGRSGENTHVLSDSLFIGNTATGNYTLVTDSGLITHGSANRMGSLFKFAYNMVGRAASYNGTTCSATLSSILSDQWFYQDFPGGNNQQSAFLINFHMPENYVAGGKIKVEYHWTTSNTTSTDSVCFYVGILSIGAGEDMTVTPVWYRTVDGCPSIAWEEDEVEVTIDATGYEPSDAVTIIIYRDTNDASDNNTSDAYINLAGYHYEINKIGGVK